MARPQRNNVDYFPFLCKEGETLFYLEETYGNDGFAVFIKLLRELANANFHHLDLSKPTKLMFLSAKCKVSKETLIAIISDLVELEKFDAELWNENNVIWCQDFIDGVQDAYLKRTNDCIDRKSLLLLLESKGVRKPAKSTPKPEESASIAPVNPQSKEEYIKEDEIKQKEIKYNIMFDLFWSSYDKKRGDKDKLKVKFKTLSEADIGLIMDYIPRYKISQPDKQYRKDPATFLNNKGWLDEIIVKEVKKMNYPPIA